MEARQAATFDARLTRGEGCWIVGPVRVYEAVTYDATGRTSLGIYASRESAPQGGDVSIEEHEVQP